LRSLALGMGLSPRKRAIQGLQRTSIGTIGLASLGHWSKRDLRGLRN
jgi:hypothetical protein